MLSRCWCFDSHPAPSLSASHQLCVSTSVHLYKFMSVKTCTRALPKCACESVCGCAAGLSNGLAVKCVWPSIYHWDHLVQAPQQHIISSSSFFTPFSFHFSHFFLSLSFLSVVVSLILILIACYITSSALACPRPPWQSSLSALNFFSLHLHSQTAQTQKSELQSTENKKEEEAHEDKRCQGWGGGHQKCWDAQMKN